MLTLLLSVTGRKTSDMFYFKFPSFNTHSFGDNDLVNHPTSAPSDNLLTHLPAYLLTYLIFLLTLLTYILTNYLLTYSLHGAESFFRSHPVLSQEGSLLLLQVPATCPYTGPDQSNPCPTPHLASWRSILILFSHLRLGFPSGLFPSGSPPPPKKAC